MLEDVAGVWSTVLTLKSRAARRGWQRGQNDDGTWFSTYVRHFPSAGITAVLEFSGATVPETDEPVTLAGLTFRGSDGELRRLGTLPPVLLAECHRDVLAIAAPAGVGRKG